MHRYESFGDQSDDDELDEQKMDTTYLPPSPSPGPGARKRKRARPALDGQDDDMELIDLDDNATTSGTSVYASLDDDAETSDAVFERAKEEEEEAENLHAHRRRRIHFISSSSDSSNISPPPPQTRAPRPASPAPPPPLSSPPPMPPPPRPATQPIHITLSRLPIMTAGQPPLSIRINTVRRRLVPSSSQPISSAAILAARRAAANALATTRARLVAIFASFGMRDRDAMVDWKAIGAELGSNDTNAPNGVDDNAIDNDDIKEDEDEDSNDNGGRGSTPPPPPPPPPSPPIDPATQREVEGWLSRTMGWYTRCGSIEVNEEEYYVDEVGEAAAAGGQRPQRQRQGRRNCMIKGSCELRAVFASEMQMQAVVRAIEEAGAMGDGVRSMATVLRFWNEEWRAENPDLAIEGDDMGVEDLLRLRAIRPLGREWEE